jgi:hypothetical protein
MQCPEHHEAIPTIVSCTDEREDLSLRKESVEDFRGGSPRTLHEGGLRDSLLNGGPVERGGLCGRRCPNPRTREGPERRHTHTGVLGPAHILEEAEAGGTLLVALADTATERNLPIVDPDVEPTLRVGAHPGLMANGRSLAAIVGKRKKDPRFALETLRKSRFIHVGPSPRRDEFPIPKTSNPWTPWIILLERLLEIKDVPKIFSRIPFLTDKDAAVHQSENDVAQVLRRMYPPMLKHRPGQGSEATQGQSTDALCQLPPADVPRFLQPLHDLLQSREQEDVSLPVKPGVLFLELIQNVIGKLEFVHRATSHPRHPRARPC